MFYPSFSDEDKVRFYSVFFLMEGREIPYYNRLIDGGLSVRENIQELIASTGTRLENEVSMYLESEISKIINTNKAFEALDPHGGCSEGSSYQWPKERQDIISLIICRCFTTGISSASHLR